MAADSSRLVETFPRPPSYYTDNFDLGTSSFLESGSIDFAAIRDDIYDNAFSERNLAFVKQSKEVDDIPQSHLKHHLLEISDNIILQAGYILNLKTVDDFHINQMKIALISLLEKFHGVLGRLRRREAKMQYIQLLEAKRLHMQDMKAKMNRYSNYDQIFNDNIQHNK